MKYIFSYKPLKATAVPIVTCVAVLFVTPASVSAHGFAGSRFFPATLVTDDPFVNDELSLPTVSSIVTPDEGGIRDTEVAVDIAKRITPNFGIEVGQTVINLKPPNESSQTGFGNLELAAKYEFFESDEHETILSLGGGIEIGGTGNKRVGADSFTTWAPVFFGQRIWRPAGHGLVFETACPHRPAWYRHPNQRKHANGDAKRDNRRA